MAWGMMVMSKRWFLILMPMSGSCMLTIMRSICRASPCHAQPPRPGALGLGTAWLPLP